MTQGSPGRLQVRLFGRFEARRGHVLIAPEAWPQRTTQLLFQLLISERGRVFIQDELIESLYPAHAADKAAKSLRSRISQLRRLLEPELKKGGDSRFVLQIGKGGCSFDAQAPCWVDVEEFQQQLQAAQTAEQSGRWSEALSHYEQAIELYRGDFLAEAPYEEWTLAPRERWREEYLAALAKLAGLYARLRQFSRALECCRRALELDPQDESFYCQKMLCHYHAGEYQKAVLAYETCVQALRAHLEVTPAQETQNLYEQIVRHEVPAPPQIFPNNLPQPLTSFIGRERTMEEIEHVLTTARLLTLTGVSGCGKTRLALQVAREQLKEYRDGVWWVDLAALGEVTLVIQAVASALGVREPAGRALKEVLIDSLKLKKALLVLDNCEHLAQACAHLTEQLLQACPELKILVTSRQVLGLAGEAIWQVPPLATPPLQPLPSLGDLQHYEAVHLFIERASASWSEFALTQENAPTVAQICYRLEGLPLAIELAATHVRNLSVEEIAARLLERLRQLSNGNDDVVSRHRTLQASLDWSYQLLGDKERVLFRQLSIFAGGFTLEAAEAVCAETAVDRSRVLRWLTGLVDKSLVAIQRRDAITRYRLLETVRQYAGEKLLEVGEFERVQEQHLQFFIGLLEKAQEARYGTNQASWFDRFAREHDNLRSALSWSLQAERTEAALQLASALWWFWYVRGYLSEGLEWLKKVLGKSKGMRTEPQARVLNGAGNLARGLSDYAAARSFHEEALTIYRGLENKRGIAATLSNLGIVTASQDDHPVARSLFEEALSLFRELGNTAGIAAVLSNLANVLTDQGDYALARGCLEESLAMRRELGEKGNVAVSLSSLGIIVRCQGDYPHAQTFLEESLALAREVEDKHCIATALRDLGYIAFLEEDYKLARARFEESVSIYRELGDRFFEAYGLMDLGSVLQEDGDYEQATALVKQSLALFRQAGVKGGIAAALSNLASVAQCQKGYEQAAALYKESLDLHRTLGEKPGVIGDLEGLARVACAQGHFDRTAHLHGAAEALRAATGSPRPPNEQTDYEQDVAAARAGLGEAALAKAWAHGRAMTLEQAIEYALNEE
ncbi:tetratricopeptide repeat protein [Candidatus Acetothermia bacterium]|nr:tetratricopeptide repeat protein [Candidatus Acetothermia bacterium]